MAAGLTDHVWNLFELLSYKIAPAPWVFIKNKVADSETLLYVHYMLLQAKESCGLGRTYFTITFWSEE